MTTASTDRHEPILEGLFRVAPRFVERSRRQAEFAAVVLHGLRRLGGPRRSVEDTMHDGAPPSEVAPSAAPARREPTVLDRVRSSPTAPEQLQPTVPGAAGPAVAPAEDQLPIDGFDSLAASQVVPRLVTLSTEELRTVQRYEQAGRHRQTILNRVEQLLADR